MNTLIDNLLDVFQGFRMPMLPIDQFAQTGRAILADKMSTYIAKNVPIKFHMLGYPMKSPNTRDKVIGQVPDMGEEISIANFGVFNAKIKEFYTPGVNVSIVSDGYVFNDIMQVSDNVVGLYNEMSKDIAKDQPVTWYELQDFYSDNNINTMRDKVMNQFGITTEILEQRILLDPDVNELYRGMIKFMSMDLAIRPFDSNNQLHKAAKKVAREMMFRNEAYSRLVQSEFTDSIRLSMHPSINNGTKYSFQLIPSQKAWTSPWHCAILLDNGEYVTIHKKDAEANGFELIYKNGQSHHYITN